MKQNSKPILQYFLDANLIDIGDDDKRYNYIEAAAKDFAEVLKLAPKEIIPYTLIAIDPNIPTEEPRLKTIDEMVTNHWKLIRQRYPDPIPIYRAAILQTLEELSQKDETIATIIYLTASPITTHLNLSDKELEIQKRFLDNCQGQYEQLSRKIWLSQLKDHTSGNLSPESKVDESEEEVLLHYVKSDDLLTVLEKASGPSNARTIEYPDKNPRFPNQNQGTAWAHEFAPRAANGLTEILNDALNANTTTVLEELSARIRESHRRLNLLSNNLENQFHSKNIQVQLLWWKDALYSPSMRKGYRELVPLQVASSLAYDLYHLIPSVGPIGTEYFLSEVFRCTNVNNEKVSLKEFLEHLSQDSSITELLPIRQSAEDGRIDLVSFSSGKRLFHDRDLKAALGLNEEYELTYLEICVWLYSSLTANRLASYES